MAAEAFPNWHELSLGPTHFASKLVICAAFGMILKCYLALKTKPFW